MINLNHLRIFYYVAKNLSFTKAAHDLCITQPAVTAQIHAFENQLNMKLFKKKGRTIFLSPESDILYEYAIKIFKNEQEIEKAIEDIKKLKRGTLYLGAAMTYARYFMPFLTSSFLKAYPNIRISLSEGSSQEMIHSLLNFKNEIAIIAQTEENPDICFIPFSREDLVVILSPNHPLVRKKTIVFEELSEEPLIMKEMGSGTRKLVNELFEQHGVSPKILMESSNPEFIKQLVQRGEGISFLLRQAVDAELKEKKLASVAVKNTPMFIDVNIAFMRHQPLSHPAETFLDLIKGLRVEKKPLQKISELKERILAHNTIHPDRKVLRP
jgi:DNA-binding transcriptional LysR family regulator